MRIKIFLLSMAALITLGCANNKKAEQFKALPFPETPVPSILDNNSERMEHMALHWWDEITDPTRDYPTDTSYISGVSVGEVEQKMANWISLLDMVGYQTATKAISRLYDRVSVCEAKDTSSVLFESFNEMVEKYMYDPNSPLRNEDFYAVYAAKLAQSDFIESLSKERYAREARLAAFNRIGTKAADFRFSDRFGKIRTLYSIKSELTLLFFSNPGCAACKEIIDVLNNDPVISGHVNAGTMAVLNIYIDGDIQEWMSYMPIYPENWYNGFDPDMVLRRNEKYYVRAIPSLYLLDKDKKVIMKDAPESKVFDWLSRY